MVVFYADLSFPTPSGKDALCLLLKFLGPCVMDSATPLQSLSRQSALPSSKRSAVMRVLGALPDTRAFSLLLAPTLQHGRCFTQDQPANGAGSCIHSVNALWKPQMKKQGLGGVGRYVPNNLRPHPYSNLSLEGLKISNKREKTLKCIRCLPIKECVTINVFVSWLVTHFHWWVLSSIRAEVRSWNIFNVLTTLPSSRVKCESVALSLLPPISASQNVLHDSSFQKTEISCHEVVEVMGGGKAEGLERSPLPAVILNFFEHLTSVWNIFYTMILHTDLYNCGKFHKTGDHWFFFNGHDQLNCTN